ncbi:MAG: hypothetical protein AAF826_02055 [Pseudomonadota bacterium]
MSVVELRPRSQWPKVEFSPESTGCSLEQVEQGLLELAIQLDRLGTGDTDRRVVDMIRLSASLGLVEIMGQLRDLKNAVAHHDGPAKAAIHARLERQIETDLTFVLSLSDLSGQPDLWD